MINEKRQTPDERSVEFIPGLVAAIAFTLADRHLYADVAYFFISFMIFALFRPVSDGFGNPILTILSSFRHGQSDLLGDNTKSILHQLAASIFGVSIAHFVTGVTPVSITSPSQGIQAALGELISCCIFGLVYFFLRDRTLNDVPKEVRFWLTALLLSLVTFFTKGSSQGSVIIYVNPFIPLASSVAQMLLVQGFSGDPLLLLAHVAYPIGAVLGAFLAREIYRKHMKNTFDDAM